jgi:hypothetical protein
MSDQIKKVSVIFFVLSIFLLSSSAQAERYAYQPTSPSIKNIDRARVVVDDGNLQEGFSYMFKDEVIYTPQYNTYVVGQHCYRGKTIRFNIPRERFTFYIDNEEYHSMSAGGSVWHRFHTGAKLNFLLKWIDSAYSVVELNQSACADVVLDTRYHLEEKLRKTQSTNIRVVVHDGSGNKVGEFTLKIRQ